MFIYIAVLSLRIHISPRLLIKKLLPTFIIAVTTASSSAAFATELDTCTKKLGIDERIANFGVPLGNVLYMPGGALYFLVIGLFMAEFYSIDINPLFITILIIMSTLLAIATPPIPGGTITCYTVFFSQLGIPLEALSIAIALDLVMDFIITAMNLACLQIELTEVSHQMGMLNLNTLKKDKGN